MDIDALHSALLSLTLLPEEIRSARDNVAAAAGPSPAAFTIFLDGLERDLRIAKAALARELGFALCACCWPPEIFATDATGRVHCPRSGAERKCRPAPGARIGSRPRRVARFTRAQKDTLLRVRDLLVDAVSGPDAGRSAHVNQAPAFVGDRVDAGNDAADRDLALNLLSQGRDALLEVEQALKRIDAGTYGICEMSGQRIPRARLEALPAARYTVECQALVEKDRKATRARPVPSAFVAWDGGEEEEAMISRAEKRPPSLTQRIGRLAEAGTARRLAAL